MRAVKPQGPRRRGTRRARTPERSWHARLNWVHNKLWIHCGNQVDRPGSVGRTGLGLLVDADMDHVIPCLTKLNSCTSRAPGLVRFMRLPANSASNDQDGGVGFPLPARCVESIGVWAAPEVAVDECNSRTHVGREHARPGIRVGFERVLNPDGFDCQRVLGAVACGFNVTSQSFSQPGGGR